MRISASRGCVHFSANSALNDDIEASNPASVIVQCSSVELLPSDEFPEPSLFAQSDLQPLSDGMEEPGKWRS